LLKLISSVSIFTRFYMTYKGGTPTAESCIEQLKDLEALVDIYSKEWLAANPGGHA
jgi:hypothetical protein